MTLKVMLPKQTTPCVDKLLGEAGFKHFLKSMLKVVIFQKQVTQ